MLPSRRQFLEGLWPSTLLLVTAGGFVRSLAAQAPAPRRQPPPSSPRSEFPPFPEPPTPEPSKPDPRVLLKKNQETIKRDVKRLAELARQLEEQIEKSDAADVLSLEVIRTAEQIEKLAKNIKNLARG